MAKRGRPKKSTITEQTFFFVSDDPELERALADTNVDFHEHRIDAEASMDTDDFEDDESFKYIHEIKLVKTYRYKRVAEYSIKEA